MVRASPDLNNVVRQMFRKRQNQLAVAGHALFQRQAKGAAAQPTTAPHAQKSHRLPRWAQHMMAAGYRTLAMRGRRAVVGIDLGASALKIARVHIVDGTPQVSALICDEYPPGAEGQAREQFLCGRLQQLKQQGLLDGRIVVGIADSATKIERITLAKMPIQELHRAIEWEVKGQMAIEKSTHSIRHIVLGETVVDGLTQYEVLVIAVPREDIISLRQMFAQQGLLVSIMEPHGLASVAACEQYGLWAHQDFIGVLEIGRLSSTFLLVRNGAVRFVRTFMMGGDSITQSIADYCQIDFDTAETDKREYGLSQMVLEQDRRVTGMETEPRVRVAHALGLYLERFASEIEYSLRYYSMEAEQAQKVLTVDQLFLLGGGALLKNLPMYFTHRLQVPVKLCALLERQSITAEARAQLGELSQHEMRMSAALGLALYPVNS